MHVSIFSNGLFGKRPKLCHGNQPQRERSRYQTIRVKFNGHSGATKYFIYYGSTNVYDNYVEVADPDTYDHAVSEDISVGSSGTWNVGVVTSCSNGASSTIVTATGNTSTSSGGGGGSSGNSTFCTQPSGMTLISIGYTEAKVRCSFAAMDQVDIDGFFTARPVGAAARTIAYIGLRSVSGGIVTGNSTITQSANIEKLTGDSYNAAVTMKGLKKGVTYEFFFTLVCGTKLGKSELYSDPVTGTTLTCNPPTGVSITNLTTTSGQLNWNTAGGASNYRIKWWRSGTAEPAASNSTTAITYPMTGLSPGRYKYKLQSYCASPDGVYFNLATPVTGNFRILSPAPVSITILPGYARSKVSWASTGTGAVYEVQYRRSTATTWTVASNTLTLNETELSGLVAGASYYYRVRSKTLGVWSVFTTSAITPQLSCSNTALTNLATSNSGWTNTTISWSGTSQVYLIRYKTITDSLWQNEIKVTGNSYVFPVGSLARGTRYDWQLTGICESPVSDLDDQLTLPVMASYSAQMQTRECLAPRNPNTFTATLTSLSVNWVLPKFVTNTDLEFRQFGTSIWNTTSAANLTAGTFTMTNLIPGIQYEVRVKSSCFDSTVSPVIPIESGYNKFTNAGTSPFTSGCYGYGYSPCGVTPITSTTARLNTCFSVFSGWVVDYFGAISETPAPPGPDYCYRELGTTTWINLTGIPANTSLYVYDDGVYRDMISKSYYVLTGLKPNTTYEWGFSKDTGPGVCAPYRWFTAGTFTTALTGAAAPANSGLAGKKDASAGTTALTLSPNPAAHEVVVHFNSNEYSKANLKIMDVSGTVAVASEMNLVPGSNSKTVSLQGVVNGTYFVVLEVGGKRHVQKLVVLR